MLLSKDFTLEGLKTNPSQYVGQDIEVYTQQQLDDYDLKQKLATVTDTPPETSQNVRRINVKKIKKQETLTHNFEEAVRRADLDSTVSQFEISPKASLYISLKT